MLPCLRFAAIVALLIGGTNAYADEEPVKLTIVPRDGTKPLVIDFERASNFFVRLFKDTCFDNRASLPALRVIASTSDWHEQAGPYPHRQDEETVEIAWNTYDGDVPYSLALTTSDYTAPALTCNLSAIALTKSKLVPLVHAALNMQIREKFSNENYDITLMDTTSDPSLRVACSTAHSGQSFDAQCSLVRLVEAHGRIDYPSAACARDTARSKRFASGASECPS